MRFVLAIALFLLSGCGHDSTRPSPLLSAEGSDTLLISPDSTWYVTGRVIDADEEYPLIGANAFLRYRLPDSDSLYIRGAATNADGDFFILVRSIRRPTLLQFRASYIGYRDTTVVMPQFSATDMLRIGNLELRREPLMRMDHDYISKPMFDKTQTNSGTVITDEEIQNLPIPK